MIAEAFMSIKPLWLIFNVAPENTRFRGATDFSRNVAA
jgi:hypothetical protein